MEDTVVSTTPATTTETSTAAPATSAPSGSSSTSERPTDVRSLSNFLQKRADASAVPATAATVPPPETAATGLGTSSDPANATATQGPIPFDVHKTALDNARTKAVAEWRAKHGWAEAVPQATFEQFTKTATQMSRDPWGHVRTFVGELLAHPEYGKSGRSEIARIMNGFRGPAGAPAPDFTPDVQVVDEHGRVSGATFSAEKVKSLVNYSVQRAVADAIGKEVAPLKQEHATRQAEARAAETSKQLNAKADEAMAEIAELLEISADAPAEQTSALYAAMNAAMEKDPTLTPHKAALQVRKSHVLPAQAGKAAQDAVDTMKKKAAGNTANGAGAAATPGKLKTVQDISRFLQSRAR